MTPHLQVLGQPSRQASAYNAAGSRSRISPLLPLKNDRKIIQGRRRGWRTRRNRWSACSGSGRPPRTPLATPPERLGGARGIQSAKILARARQRDIHETGFVARPARSAIAKPLFQIGQVGAGVRASILAGLPPKRQPLARMVVAHSLRGAHDNKHDCPNGHVRQVATDVARAPGRAPRDQASAGIANAPPSRSP